jgi:hypothetical protein
MIEGDFYPELRHTRIASSVMELRAWRPVSKNIFDEQAEYDVDNQVVASVKIEMPEADWQAIMEIYKSHYHAMSSNQSVQSAWQQYQMLLKLSA